MTNLVSVTITIRGEYPSVAVGRIVADALKLTPVDGHLSVVVVGKSDD